MVGWERIGACLFLSRQALNASVAQLLEGLPAQDDMWCERMVKGQLGQEEAAKLAEWKFDEARLQQLPVMKVVEPADKAEAGLANKMYGVLQKWQ